MQRRKGPDTLDKTVTYLAKRDGIDKASRSLSYSPKDSHLSKAKCTLSQLSLASHDMQVLKVIRYSTKLALATALKNDSSDLAQRLKEFEGSIGTSRCTLLLSCGLYRSVELYSCCCLVCLQKGISPWKMAF